MTCPKCEASIEITRSINLGADHDNDDYVFNTFACTGCALRGAGADQANRRGGGESWRHRGVEISTEEFARIETELLSCPNPRSASCRCPAHTKYRSDTVHRPPDLVAPVSDTIIRLG